MRLCLVIFFFLNGHSLLQAQTIDSIYFEGLTKTSEVFLREIIICKEGMPYSDSMRYEDEKILNNTNLFFEVISKATYNEANKSYNLYFYIKESTYIFPTIDISGFKSVFKLQLGATNINYKGEQKTVGIWYQLYDRHSFSLYHRVARHVKKPYGHDVVLAKYSTTEPLYFNNLTSIFNFDNYSLWLNGSYWLNRFTNVQVGFTPIYEIYNQLDSVDVSLPARKFTFWKYRVNGSVNFKKVDYLYERLDGTESSLYLESIQTPTMANASFLMAKLTTAYHYFIKERGNLHWRHQIAIASNNEGPFSPFVLDGFLNLRGIGNRVARGTGIHFMNVEYRHTVLKNKFLMAQAVGFADAGALRAPGDSWTQLFDLAETKAFIGLGIRLHSNKIYKTIFRLDYGLNLTDDSIGALSFGLGQFF